MWSYIAKKILFRKKKKKKKGFIRRIVGSVALSFATTFALEWAKKKGKQAAQEAMQQEAEPVEFETKSVRKPSSRKKRD